MALALALASGSAEAQLVLKIEDPALTGGELQVVDNQVGDLNEVVGVITTGIDENGVSTVINAISSQTKTLPRLVLDLEGFQSPSDSVTVSLTDTDFEVFEETPGQATVTGIQDFGDVASFTFAGDSANQPFVEGFIITNGSVSEPEINAVQDVSVAPVGSLTLSGVVEKGESFEEVLEMTFTMVLQVGKSTGRNCPPIINGETVSRMGTVGEGCVILNAIIEDGGVLAQNISGGFTIVDSVVRNGDINLESMGGIVTVARNRVTNGNIELKDVDKDIGSSPGPVVEQNIVNGNIDIRDSLHPSIVNNIFSNGNMVVRSNGTPDDTPTVVRGNVGLGIANIEVDENDRVEVMDNTATRDITCEEEEYLVASGNEAGRKLECPKDDGLFGGDGLID
jgi:hypothetical protein